MSVHSLFSTMMKMTEHVWTVILIIFCGIPIESHANDDFYTAGVVEFRPNIFRNSSVDMLKDHLGAYRDIIHSAAANETDIIVFPEGTLNSVFHMTAVPAPDDNIIPCLQHDILYTDFFIKLSCAARDVKKYIVINLTELENCTAVLYDPRPCATSGFNIYNTNIVFDRTGRVVSRYRKVHIYVEAKNTTFKPEYAIFETDFGVRFGHFICFDILFYTPAQELVTKYGVKNVIFTSFFYSELPFLTASQLQQSWAWGNNVNLLAAGASYPTAGATGSGIYAGNLGHLVSVMVGGTGERKLYVARVPKAPENRSKITKSSQLNSGSTKARLASIKLMKDPQIGNYTSKLLEFSIEQNISLHLCQLSFCCDINLNVTYFEPPADAATYFYRFGVFNGRRTYEKQEWSDIKVCALYSCTSDDPLSCGEVFEENLKVAMNIKFESIEVKGYFEKTGESLIMPNSLDDKLYALNSDVVAWQKTEESNYFDVNFKLKRPHQNLLTFGIYSHYFERSGSAIASLAFSFIGCSLIFVAFSFL